MRVSFCGKVLAIAVLVGGIASSSTAIEIQFDFRHDVGNFFQSARSRATLKAAAGFFEDLLTDDLLAIEPSLLNTWTAVFTNPSSGSTELLVDLEVPADTLIVFVGARDLSEFGGDALAQSGSGLAASGTQLWVDTLLERGQGTVVGPNAVDYATWGGAISFNETLVWHDDHTVLPSAVEVDLFSATLHELGHLLGFGRAEILPGQSTSWSNLVVDGGFKGPSAQEEFGGIVPLGEGNANWAEGTPSVVYGTQLSQDTAMDHILQLGVREEFTNLDVAALIDIGWQLESLPPVLIGDYNADGAVTTADYTVWRNTLGSPSDLSADGNGDLRIDEVDYRIWRDAFGTQGEFFPNALAQRLSVPEPSGPALCLLSVVIIAVAMRGAGRRRSKLQSMAVTS